MGDDHRIRSALAWLATAVAAGFLFALLLRPEPVVREVVRERPASGTGTRAGSSDAGQEPDPATPSPWEESHGDATPGDGPADVDPGAPAARIEVTVLGSTGSPVLNATVYALPAGARGVDEQDRIPFASTDESGRAVLPVALAGNYDLGALSEAVLATARDVHVEAGATARATLTLPAGRPLAFQCEGWPPPVMGVATASIHLQPAAEDSESGGRRFRFFPGRSEGLLFALSLKLDGNGTAASPSLMEGVPCRFQTKLHDVHRTPDGLEEWSSTTCEVEPFSGTALPGETVRLRLRDRASAILKVRTEPPLPQGVRLMFVTTVIQGDRRSELQTCVNGPPPGEAAEWEFPLHGLEGPARIEWRESTDPNLSRGAAVVPGAADLVLGTRTPGTAEVIFRIDPSTAGGPSEREREVPGIAFEFPGLPADRKEGGSFTIAVLPPEGDPEDDIGYWELAFPDELDGEIRGRTAMCFVLPDLASGPMTLPREGSAVVRLRKGGFLLVAPEFLPQPGLGALTLRRADGLPVPLMSAEARSLDGVRPEPTVVQGALLGPLPEGDHSFEVRLGGARLPDARAFVKAGRIEVLRIRR